MSADRVSFGDLLRRLRSGTGCLRRIWPSAPDSASAASVTWSAAPAKRLGWKPCVCWPMLLRSGRSTGRHCWLPPVRGCCASASQRFHLLTATPCVGWR